MKRDQTTDAEGRQPAFKAPPDPLAFGPRRDSGRLGSFVLALAASLLGLVVAEGVSRVVMPVSPGARFVTAAGKPLELTTRGLMMLPPGTVISQIAPEYNAKATITNQGYRAPDGGRNPRVVFLGDSFTFGVGLSDGQTFPAIYCMQLGVACANLGRPATGTVKQLAVLEHYLKQGWRPCIVKLFMFVSTRSLMPGNDLWDNLNESHLGASKSRRVSEPIVGFSGLLLKNSNLARILYFVYGPLIRAALSPRPAKSRLREALEVTRTQLARFQRLAGQYHFVGEIYIIHPVQDMIVNNGPATTNTIRGIAGKMAVFDTSDGMPGDARQYYFSYDQHLNAKGAAAIARFLLARDEERARSRDAGHSRALPEASSRRPQINCTKSMGDT